MTLEQQEAKRRAEVMLAFADGAPIEWRVKDGGIEWHIDWGDVPRWNWPEFDYRVSPNPVVNWDAMPAWANWVAMEKDGQWCWHEKEPQLSDDIWASGPIEGFIPSEYAPKYAGTQPWHNLIIERPKK
jgi:hypothetical protein